MRLIKNNTELIGIKDQNIKISLVFETDIEIQAKLEPLKSLFCRNANSTTSVSSVKIVGSKGG